MERIPVSSSHILAIGYDADQQTLEVEFKDGSVYQYSGVPSNEHEALMSSDSKGGYLGAHIKKHYPYMKL